MIFAEKNWTKMLSSDRLAAIELVHEEDITMTPLRKALVEKFRLKVSVDQLKRFYLAEPDLLKDVPVRTKAGDLAKYSHLPVNERPWVGLTQEQKIDLIKEIHFDGASATDLMKIINQREGENVSRSGIIGFMNRNKGALHKHRLRGVAPKLNSPKPSKVRKPSSRKRTKSGGKKFTLSDLRGGSLPLSATRQDPIDPFTLDDPVKNPRNLTLMELGRHDCRYVTSIENGRHLFCGHQQSEGSSYCPSHRKRTTLHRTIEKA